MVKNLLLAFLCALLSVGIVQGQNKKGKVQYQEVVVPQQVKVKCSVCNGTGRTVDFELGMSTMCMYCYNGYVYKTVYVKKKVPVTFTGGSNPCTLCRSTYCSNYNGKKEMNARCQNPSCGHTWQQHKW